jgi:hypothetical protein
LGRFSVRGIQKHHKIFVQKVHADFFLHFTKNQQKCQFSFDSFVYRVFGGVSQRWESINTAKTFCKQSRRKALTKNRGEVFGPVSFLASDPILFLAAPCLRRALASCKCSGEVLSAKHTRFGQKMFWFRAVSLTRKARPACGLWPLLVAGDKTSSWRARKPAPHWVVCRCAQQQGPCTAALGGRAQGVHVLCISAPQVFTALGLGGGGAQAQRHGRTWYLRRLRYLNGRRHNEHDVFVDRWAARLEATTCDDG